MPSPTYSWGSGLLRPLPCTRRGAVYYALSHVLVGEGWVGASLYAFSNKRRGTGGPINLQRQLPCRLVRTIAKWKNFVGYFPSGPRSVL